MSSSVADTSFVQSSGILQKQIGFLGQANGLEVRSTFYWQWLTGINTVKVSWIIHRILKIYSKMLVSRTVLTLLPVKAFMTRGLETRNLVFNHVSDLWRRWKKGKSLRSQTAMEMIILSMLFPELYKNMVCSVKIIKITIQDQTTAII